MMRGTSFIFIIITFGLLGCASDTSERNSSPEIVIADTVFDAPDSSDHGNIHVKTNPLLWKVDETKGFKLQRPVTEGIDTMSAINVIRLINNNYDSIHLDYTKTAHDTIFVDIPQSKMLTQKMGSTGADMYMAAVTYSLTELKGIRFVHFNFEEGDHASPGIYQRSDFKNFQ